MAHGTDPKSPKFFTKLGVLLSVIVDVCTSIFSKMSESELQHWILKKEAIRKELSKVFKVNDLFIEEKEQWRKFYQKHFSLDLNFADVVVPEKPTEGSWRLLIIAQGLTLNQVYSAMSKTFKCWKYYDDLDENVTKNVRDTKTAYAIWVRDGVEPDAQYLGKSTNQADPNMTLGVTLLERMIMEIIYFDETGKHLDIKGVTFCSGSRNSDGNVPGVYWDSDDRVVQVDWYFLVNSDSDYGLRSVVS